MRFLGGLPAVAAVAVFSVVPAHAATEYSNGTPDFTNGSSITQNRAVDNFTIADAIALTSIRFWAVFNNNNPVGQFSGDVSWAIYENSSNSVGSLVASGSASGLTMTDIGNGGGNFNAHQIDVSVSAVVLAAGAYWLELHEGPSLTSTELGSTTFWATSAQSGNSKTQGVSASFPDSLVQFGGELAFELDASEVPEPGSAVLMGVGLAACIWRIRKSRTA